MRIYISGPITGTDDARDRFEAAARLITARGFVPVNPVPLVDALPDGLHTEYMLLALKLLELSDAIYMLPGWRQSHGARIEHGDAQRLGMKIYYGEERGLA